MKRLSLALLALIYSNFLFPQSSKIENIIEVDSIHYFQFGKGSIDLSASGKKKLDAILHLIALNKIDENKRILVLHGIYTEEEEKKDYFIGLKRCKIVIDYLSAKHNFKSDFFEILDSKPYFNNRHVYGVGYYLRERTSIKPDTTLEFDAAKFSDNN